jgi:hypothetical protein
MFGAMNEQSDDAGRLAALRAQVDQVEEGLLRRIDPGMRAMVIAVAVFVLVIASLLPWVSGVPGWQLLFGHNDLVKIDVLPKVFAGGVFGFGLLGSALSLGLRRWVVAWAVTLGCGACTVLGVVSVWSQQTSTSHQPGPGPGIGLVLCLPTMAILAITWMRVVWSRPGGVFGNRAD